MIFTRTSSAEIYIFLGYEFNLRNDGGVHHEQIRDLAKFWEKEGVVYSFFGVENQTSSDKNMILRVLAYDGASYKKQVENEEAYPVQTLYQGSDS